MLVEWWLWCDFVEDDVYVVVDCNVMVMVSGGLYMMLCDVVCFVECVCIGFVGVCGMLLVVMICVVL